MLRHAKTCPKLSIRAVAFAWAAWVLDKDRNFMEFLLLRLDGLQHLQGLKALIAARNRITLLDGISPKKNPLLETIVLSHNQLQSVSLAGGCQDQDMPIIIQSFHAEGKSLVSSDMPQYHFNIHLSFSTRQALRT